MSTSIERVYDFVHRKKRRDEFAVLVDRLWPRGVKKEALDIDDWVKEIAPSNELRKWYQHDPEKWAEFQRRYDAELKEHEDGLAELRKIATTKRLVLLTSTKEVELSHAAHLAERI